MASTSKYVAVVAIDFGTTYSGFAFSFNDRRGEGGIHMNREWGTDEGRSTLKTPTSILLSPNKEFDSFGYEADDKYVHFTHGEEREYFYLKHFKMELHKSKVTYIVCVRYDCMLRWGITGAGIVRGCLHDTGATFAPERVHSGSLSWLYICLHDTLPSQNVMPARVTPA